MRDKIYPVTKCIIAAALTAAAIWLALNNGDNADTFKGMAGMAVAYFFASRSKTE